MTDHDPDPFDEDFFESTYEAFVFFGAILAIGVVAAIGVLAWFVF